MGIAQKHNRQKFEHNVDKPTGEPTHVHVHVYTCRTPHQTHAVYSTVPHALV